VRIEKIPDAKVIQSNDSNESVESEENIEWEKKSSLSLPIECRERK
jgi:hypothetical protein